MLCLRIVIFFVFLLWSASMILGKKTADTSIVHSTFYVVRTNGFGTVVEWHCERESEVQIFQCQVLHHYSHTPGMPWEITRR